MCGIAGFQIDGGDRDFSVQSLLDSLAARGPDDHAHAEHGGYHLVQTRLAVIDLSGRVSYPMGNETGDVWLLFNGEIYDHRALRSELEGLGHRFKTDCDAEVVLHGFEQWGTGVFPRLNGMFAVALADERSGELTLARDRIGIKPLVHATGGPFAFSSDAISLVRAGLNDGEVDQQAIAEYAALHYVPHPRTGIAGIVQLAPGTALTVAPDGGKQVERWAPRPFEGPEPEDRVPIERVERALRASVARQLVADVEVGVLLSRGLDSSLVAALAAEAGARPQAFTLGFAGHGDYDEVAGAARLANALGMPHHYENQSTGFVESVTMVAAAHDQPFADSSAIPTLALARLARQRVKVVLSGTGGDDLFAGYYRHRAHRLRRLVSMLPASLKARLASAPIQRGGERRGSAGLARSYLVRLARAGSGRQEDQYLGLVGAMTSSAGAEALLVSPSIGEARAAIAERLELHADGPDDVLRAIQRFEFASYVPGDLLAKEDRATMAVGLEARVPLLDNEMLAIAELMPERQKVRLSAGKLPMRAIGRSKLPTFARRGRKRGFAVPLRDLFAGPWREEAVAWLRDSDSTLVDGARTAELVSRTPSAAPDVWALAVLAAWEHRLRDARAEGRGSATVNASPRYD